MTEFHEEPIIRDKRKIDPVTGEAREEEKTSRARAAHRPSADSAGSPDSPDSPESADSADEAANLADLKAENAKLADELARANAATYNVNQEYSAYVRRAKENESVALRAGIEKVADALMSVLDDIDLARQHDDLEGPFKSVAEKLENTLEMSFNMTRYGQVGEEFDPAYHEALMDEPSTEVTVQTIAQVIQPGYRIGEKVLRPARVLVKSPA